MQKIYGVIDAENVFHDTSLSERGAKSYATRNGFNKVGYRLGYNAFTTHEKIKNKWEKIIFSE